MGTVLDRCHQFGCCETAIVDKDGSCYTVSKQTKTVFITANVQYKQIAHFCWLTSALKGGGGGGGVRQELNSDRPLHT